MLYEHLREQRNKQHSRWSGYRGPTAYPVPSECTLRSYYITQIPGMGVYSVTNTIHHWAITGLKSRELRGEVRPCTSPIRLLSLHYSDNIY